jgi:hypothetical protein
MPETPDGGWIMDDPPPPDFTPPTDEEERKRLLASGFTEAEVDDLFAARRARPKATFA